MTYKYIPTTTAALALMVMQPTVHAQQPGTGDTTQATGMERVQITGSRINLRQEQLSGVGPVTVIDAETIQRSGAISVETLLQRLPSSAGTAGNQSSAYWTSNGYGTTQVNLRGLGIDRTLVLLNGRRVVSGGTGANSSVDLNMIPVAMIERIEVLKDGASAIYGADAVAGVVNIITKKAIEGVEASVRYGRTEQGDGAEKSADIVWGTRGERGSMMASLNYSESEEVNLASRAPCALFEDDGELVCSGSSSTIGGRARLADGRRINFNQDPNGNPRGFETYSAARHAYNSNPFLNAVNPIKRVGLSAFGNMRLSDKVDLFSELMFTNRQSEQLATPGAIGVYRPIEIAANHPTNPTGQNLTLERRRVAEVGPRHFFQETNTFRIVAGLKGLIGEKWDWSASLNWGRNTGVDGMTNIINLDRVDATLNAATCGASPTAAPCGNYLGYGNLSPAVLEYIHFTTRDHGGNDQKSFNASISGELFSLPAGAVGFASGFEYRREKGWRDPDSLIVSGAANTNAQDPIAGQYSAREVFAELSVPLLAKLPLVNSLTANVAARYSDYSLFGSQGTYKLGLDWQVIPSLKMRANRSTAFRVPNVPELFGGVSEGNLTTTDPCNNWNTLDPNSNVYKNCQASGVPVGFRQFGPSILTTGGGNPNLEPEEADTFTVGAVWTPSKALTLTLDYFNIEIDNAIETVPGSTKLSVCFNSPGLAHIFCSPSSFTRDPRTGEINFLSSQPANAAQQRVSGVDFGAMVDFTVFGWASSLTADVSRLNRFDVAPFPGGETIEYAGKITGGRGSYAEWRSTASLTTTRGPWSGSYTVQYIGSADDINAAPTDIGSRAPSIAYHNASVKYAFNKAMAISFGVDNLFDKRPPYIQSWTDGNTDTMTYDLLGRRWHVRLGYKF
ncbi:TonB-dependent receptor [Massilia niastensis]|uniref:TonB-dependent receptor n=1 Tax=Massilia niastensis TaxID=544911 RepID=UPI0003678A5F|nr:TonB-dependent receptor [Massilia niastensis]